MCTKSTYNFAGRGAEGVKEFNNVVYVKYGKLLTRPNEMGKLCSIGYVVHRGERGSRDAVARKRMKNERKSGMADRISIFTLYLASL